MNSLNVKRTDIIINTSALCVYIYEMCKRIKSIKHEKKRQKKCEEISHPCHQLGWLRGEMLLESELL